MRETEAYILEAKETITESLIENICKQFNVTPDIAMNKLIKTKTYQLLNETKSNLYTESLEYVWNKLLAEFDNNISEWKKF